MKVGDLVRIQPWCKNKGALAIVVSVPPWSGEVDIRYLNPADNVQRSGGRGVKTANLILVSETNHTQN